MGMPSPPTRPRLPWACSRCEGGHEDEQVWACRCVSWYNKDEKRGLAQSVDVLQFGEKKSEGLSGDGMREAV